MKRIIIIIEALILCALVIAVITVVIPKLHALRTEEDLATEPPPKEAVTLEFEHDPFTEYRIDGISSSQMFTYFTELANNAEYSSGGQVHQLIQKWQEPITYKIYGAPTEKDMEILLAFFDELNAIHYFPGIYEVADEEDEKLSIYFIDKNLFDITFGDVVNNEDCDGAAEYWFYTDTCEIYQGRVGYVTETSQDIRNSVLIEEIVNVIGLSDTYMREDSIVYQYSSDVYEPSDIDWIIIKALYHPLIKAGMTAEECKSTPIFDY